MERLCISSETQVLVKKRLVIADIVHPPLIMRNYVGQWGRLGVTWEAIFSYLLPPLPHNHSPLPLKFLHQSPSFLLPLFLLLFSLLLSLLTFLVFSSSSFSTFPIRRISCCYHATPTYPLLAGGSLQPLWSITAPFHALPREGDNRNQSQSFLTFFASQLFRKCDINSKCDAEGFWLHVPFFDWVL